MFRFNLLRRIGVDSDILFRSVSKDRAFMQTQMNQVGNVKYALAPAGTAAAKQKLDERDEEMKKKAISEGAADGDAVKKDDDDTFSRKMTQEELNRFTTSLWSKENLHNKKVGSIPTLVVDEATGLAEGVNYPDPCRYGTELEWNGIVTDF